MAGEGQIVELDGRCEASISGSVLFSNSTAVEKGGIRSEVSKEAEDVDGGEINGSSRSTSSLPVEQWLRVEAERPRDSINPAKNRRQPWQEARHYG